MKTNVEFQIKRKAVESNVLYTEDLIALKNLSVLKEGSKTDSDLENVTFESRLTIPDYGVYLGCVEEGQVPEIVIEGDSTYVLIFKKKEV